MFVIVGPFRVGADTLSVNPSLGKLYNLKFLVRINFIMIIGLSRVRSGHLQHPSSKRRLIKREKCWGIGGRSFSREFSFSIDWL